MNLKNLRKLYLTKNKYGNYNEFHQVRRELEFKYPLLKIIDYSGKPSKKFKSKKESPMPFMHNSQDFNDEFIGDYFENL